jgi:hypothetical protein
MLSNIPLLSRMNLAYTFISPSFDTACKSKTRKIHNDNINPCTEIPPFLSISCSILGILQLSISHPHDWGYYRGLWVGRLAR